MVFFCLTGIFLNHLWYDDEHRGKEAFEVQVTEQQQKQWRLIENDEWAPQVTDITTYLRHSYRWPYPSSIDQDSELGELIFEFKFPGGFAHVMFDSSKSSYKIEKESGSAVGILNDLHKGRHSGTAWFLLIDLSALLITLFGITGMILIFQGRRYRIGGIVSAVFGLLTPVMIYLVFVPRV